MKFLRRNRTILCVSVAFLVLPAACGRRDVTVPESVIAEMDLTVATEQGLQPETAASDMDTGETGVEGDTAEVNGIRETAGTKSEPGNTNTGNTDVEEMTEHLAGKVHELTQDGIILSRTVILEGSTVQMVEEEHAEKIRVIYTPDTGFEHWVIRSGGADIDRTRVSASDIREGMMLELSGYYEGTDYIASLVLIEEDE